MCSTSFRLSPGSQAGRRSLVFPDQVLGPEATFTTLAASPLLRGISSLSKNSSPWLIAGRMVPGAEFPLHVAVESSQAGNWRTAIHELAAIRRPSASDGERRAADLIADRLRAIGCDATVEEERAHGGYWWPIGLVNALAAAGAALTLRRSRPWRRAITAALAGAGATALWDDLGHGHRWFRRAVLPHRATWNVVAETGDADAERTVVFIAHHDAAHSGLVFHPILPRIPLKLAPGLHARAGRSFPLMYAVWLGPVLVCAGAILGARRVLAAGAAVAAGATAAMADIGARASVPGANDNLSAVGVVIALASRLREQPVNGVRVLLVSKALVEAAAVAGRPIVRGLRTTAATDAIIALRAGYPVATLASVDETKLPMNYHWPNDVPDALHWVTIEDAIAVCEQFLRLRAD
jgi:hypothetical protein